MPTVSDLDPHLILFTPDQIRTRVAEMAAEIRHDIPGSVHFVTVLKGAVVFLADLIRCVEGDVTLDFMSVSSYGDTTTSGEVRVLKDLDISLTDKDVVLVEDIVDTGVTLTYLHTILRTRHPRSLRTACLLSKPSRRMINASPDTAWIIPRGSDIFPTFELSNRGLDLLRQKPRLGQDCLAVKRLKHPVFH
jgi:hypoxanthine phosphoribosyltransferase